MIFRTCLVTCSALLCASVCAWLWPSSVSPSREQPRSAQGYTPDPIQMPQILPLFFPDDVGPPPPPVPTELAVTPAEARLVPNVLGITSRGDNPRAWLQIGQQPPVPVQQNDILQGWQIEEISPTTVVLFDGELRVTLTLFRTD